MRWRPYQNIVLDCDSTLTRIEGIDELAKLCGRGAEVCELTRQAMEGEMPLEEVFAHRLALLRPTRGQIEHVGELYIRNLVEDAREVVRALQYVGRRVYIISGGFVLALRRLAAYLGIPLENVLGVDLWFDELQGEWFRYHKHQYRPNPEERYLAFDETTPTVHSTGKITAIGSLGRQPGGHLLVGDGASDLAAKQVADLFVGYGGVVTRPTVEQNAEVYIRCESLAPVFVLALGPDGVAQVEETPFRELFEKGLRLILDGQVDFRGRFAELPAELASKRRSS